MLLYIVKYETKFLKFNLDFFLCHNYVRCNDISLVSMKRSIATQKQCITKKIVSMHNIFLCILEMYSVQQFGTLYFQKTSFPTDFYRDDHVSLCFQVKI